MLVNETDRQWVRTNLGELFNLEVKLVTDKLGVFRQKVCITEVLPSEGDPRSRVVVEINSGRLTEKDKEEIITYRDRVLKSKWGKNKYNFYDIQEKWEKDIKGRKVRHDD